MENTFEFTDKIGYRILVELLDNSTFKYSVYFKNTLHQEDIREIKDLYLLPSSFNEELGLRWSCGRPVYNFFNDEHRELFLKSRITFFNFVDTIKNKLNNGD